MPDYRVLVFTYDFSHKKTQDLLFELALNSVDVVLVVGAPSVELIKKANWDGYTPLPHCGPYHPSEVCSKFGYKYVVLAHSESEKLACLVREENANIGIIAGARIIERDVIELFKYGIINYHPGKIPETSGLDSLYWTFEKNVKPVVTAHLIDYRIDAGELISRQNVDVVNDDSVASISYKLYQAQLQAHQKICKILSEGDTFITEPVVRPEKNKAMNNKQRKDALEKFDGWKKNLL